MNKDTILKWCYRVFCYIVPSGIALWTMLIGNLVDKDASTASKLTGAGIFTLVVIVLISIYFFGRHLKLKQTELVDKVLVCTDNEEKEVLIAKKQRVEKAQDIFHNTCFIAPFILLWVVCGAIETGVVSLRGTLMAISISMLTGLGFNCISKK